MTDHVLKEQMLTRWDTYLHGRREGSHTAKDALRHQGHKYLWELHGHICHSQVGDKRKPASTTL